MAQATYFLRKLQLGPESTAGTAVPATFKLVGEAKMTPMIEREFEEFPRGVRAPVTDGGFAISRSSEIEFEGNLTYEEICIFLNSGVDLVATTGAGPYTHTFTPVLTGPPALKSYTAEFVVEGDAKHYEREAAYILTSELEIELAANEPAKMKAKMFGRAEQTSTMTSALSPITGRTQVPSNLFKVYIDNSGGTIGSTQVTGLIRAATMNIKGGAAPDFTLEGRSDLDMTGVQPQNITGTLELTMEHTAAAATQIARWRGTAGVPGYGGVQLIRLVADNGAAGADNKKITFDGAWKYVEAPDFSEEDGTEIVTMKLELEYDSTYGKAFEAVIINGLTALP